MKTFVSMAANWQTTLLGILALPVALGAFLTSLGNCLTAIGDNDPSTVANWSMVGVTWTALTGSVGLLFARDGNKTSKQSGAE